MRAAALSAPPGNARDVALVAVGCRHGAVQLLALPGRAGNLGGFPAVLALVRLLHEPWGWCGVFVGVASRCHPQNLVATKSRTGMVQPLVLEKKYIRSSQAIDC